MEAIQKLAADLDSETLKRMTSIPQPDGLFGQSRRASPFRGPRQARKPWALVILLLASGCATGGVGTGQACRSDLASHESSLNELVDSAALQNQLESIWKPVDGLVLGWVRYDSTGARDTIGIRTEALSDSDRKEVGKALFDAVLGSPGKKTGTNIFLGDEHGPAIRRLARIEACEPEILNRKTVEDAVEKAARELRLRERREVILRAKVSVDGVVSDIQVHRSAGDPRIDLLAVRALQSA